MLRAADVFTLHCSQHAVLHVKVVDISVICGALRAEGGAEGTGSVLLHQEAPVTFTGCQSFNTDRKFLNVGFDTSEYKPFSGPQVLTLASEP